MPSDPRRGMLQGAQMRDQRTSVDTGTGEKRLAGGRVAHVGRGDFFNFYEDIGVSTTEEGAKQYRKRDAEIKKDFSERSSVIDKSSKEISSAESSWNKSNQQLQEAKSKMPSSVKGAVDKAYQETQKTFIPVRITDPSGTKVEATYMLPKDVAVSVSASKGVQTAWINQGGKTFLNVLPKSGGRYIGQEMHDALRGATVSVKNKFYEQNTPVIKKQLDEGWSNIRESEGQLQEGRVQIDLAKGQLNTAKSMLSGDKQLYAKSKEDMLSDYQKKVETIGNIFSNLKVKKGRSDGANA
jgi:hypothetical protein